MSFRRLLLAILALPLLVLLAVTGFWFVVTSRLESGWRQELADARAAGWTIDAGLPVRGGWPLAATLKVPRVAISGDGAAVPVPFAWGAQAVVLRIALIRPGMLVVAASGPERLRLAGGPDMPVAGDAVRLLVALGADTPPELRALNLRIGRPGAASPDGGLTVGSLRAQATPAAAAAGFTLDATAIGLPASPSWLFGPRIAALSTAGVLHGPFPAPGAAPSSPEQAATAWRNGGGTLEIDRLALDWGPLKLSATGTLRLDQALQPAGEAVLRVPDYARVIDALAAEGRIAAPAALAAKAVIGLIARANDQAPGAVALPVGVHDRTVTLGRIPLARVPQFVWPAP